MQKLQESAQGSCTPQRSQGNQQLLQTEVTPCGRGAVLPSDLLSEERGRRWKPVEGPAQQAKPHRGRHLGPALCHLRRGRHSTTLGTPEFVCVALPAAPQSYGHRKQLQVLQSSLFFLRNVDFLIVTLRDVKGEKPTNYRMLLPKSFMLFSFSFLVTCNFLECRKITSQEKLLGKAQKNSSTARSPRAPPESPGHGGTFGHSLALWACVLNDQTRA